MMYTQNNEEEIILNYFNNRHGANMCVLDCGSNDGKTFSNSLKVIELGWSGVLIEPSPRAFERLKELHKGNALVSCYQIAITQQDGSFELHESDTMLNTGDVSLVSSIKQEETEKWRNADVKFNTVTTYGMCFNSFYKIAPNKKYNLISIDTEGFDLDILRQINLNEVGCEMLIVEFNGKDEDLFTDYVSPFGLKLHSKNPENLIYTK